MRSLLKVLITGVLLTVLVAAPAAAQDSGTYVTGNVVENDPDPLPVDPADPGASVLPATLERDPATSGTSGTTLPVTGGDVVGLVILGLGLLVAGGAAIAITRSRRPVAA